MFRFARKRKIILVVGTLCSIFACGHADATVGYLLEGTGPVSTSMGGTGSSYNIGNSGMINNPATLLMMPQGQNFDGNIDTLIIPNIKFKNLATNETAKSNFYGDNNNPFFLPSISYSFVMPKWAFGIGVFPGGGLGTNYGTTSWLSNVGSINTGTDVFDRFVGIRIPLAFAYKPTNRLAIGAALDVVYEGLNLATFVPGPELGQLASQGLASGSIVGGLSQIPGLQGAYVRFNKNNPILNAANGWGVGGRIGFTYEVCENTHIGGSFNFRTNVSDLTGSGTLSAVTSGGVLPLYGRYSIHDFQLPSTLILGASSQLTPRLLVAFDFKRIFFAKTNQSLSFSFNANNGGSLNVNIPTYGRDISVFAFGGAYSVSRALTLRAGLQYAQETENPSYLSSLLPGVPQLQWTGGVGYQVSSKSQINVALEYANKVETGYQFQTTHQQIEIGIGYSHNF